jgi:hypothetical protein
MQLAVFPKDKTLAITLLYINDLPNSLEETQASMFVRQCKLVLSREIIHRN